VTVSLDALYREHVDHLGAVYAESLAAAAAGGIGAEGVLLHSGTAACYAFDDAEIFFRSVPHFAWWVPLPGPDHLLLVRPGEKPHLLRTVPQDYWYEVPAPLPPHCEGIFDYVEVGSRGEAANAVGDTKGLAYIGDDPSFAERIGIPDELQQPKALLAQLDWARAVKTGYETACLRDSAERAALGHRAARETFERGGTEREIHAAYLAATRATENEAPYANIVALDEKAGILHYQNKRDHGPGRLLLIDAGASAFGYATDVTRTYLSPDEREGVLAPLLDGMDALQRQLVAGVRPGRPYTEIHRETHERLATLLAGTGLVRVSAAEAVESGLTRAFLPHGVGHHLGLQVHDVGGHQAEPSGGRRPPPEEHPFLRNTRTLEAGHVVTIEPGMYFIPMLLQPLREGSDAARVDWKRVDSLAPFGGIRVEDDVLCTEDGREDLTRPHVPGHRD
jgi:Xaa-Pro dipeptidase